MGVVLEDQTEDVISPTTVSKEKVSPVVADFAYLVVKRCFDIVFSLLLGIVLFIPMLFVALLIKIESPGPAIFKQERLGKDGKSFTIYKFRSMKMDAPSEIATNKLLNSGDYTTRIGKLLRVTSIDELPQLWNILKGDMSFVGYRPVCVTETELNDLRREYGVFSMRPGLTGYAQVNGRDNVFSYKDKVEMDAYYVQNASVKLDIQCLLQTFSAVLSREGAK